MRKMIEVFGVGKPIIGMLQLKAYIEETRHYVLPLLRKAKTVYPEDADVLFVLKYHLVSVVDSIDATIQLFEQESECRPTGDQKGEKIV